MRFLRYMGNLGAFWKKKEGILRYVKIVSG